MEIRTNADDGQFVSFNNDGFSSSEYVTIAIHDGDNIKEAILSIDELFNISECLFRSQEFIVEDGCL